jgi:hypothetical protein
MTFAPVKTNPYSKGKRKRPKQTLWSNNDIERITNAALGKSDETEQEAIRAVNIRLYGYARRHKF